MELNSEFWTVYLLMCCDGRVYTGCAQDVEKRIREHREGRVQFTKSRLPVRVLVMIRFEDRLKAFQFEKYLKSGSGRAFLKRHFVGGTVSAIAPSRGEGGLRPTTIWLRSKMEGGATVDAVHPKKGCFSLR